MQVLNNQMEENKMSYERLTQIDINKEGLPQDGQVFSLVKTRQTVWAQRQKSEHNPGSAYTLAGVLPENAAGKLASIKGQVYVAFERGAAERQREDIVASLREDLRKDIRFI